MPRFFSEEPGLGNWVSIQRYAQSKGRLWPQRKARLETLGFTWAVRDARWEAHFAQLQRHVARYGHARVDAAEDDALYQWLSVQRRRVAARQLDAARAKRLEALGVDLRPGARATHVAGGALAHLTFDELWEKRLAELVAYRKAHGHCDVPRPGSLGKWVDVQRRKHAAGELSVLRSAKLEAAGLEWVGPRARNAPLRAKEKERLAAVRAAARAARAARPKPQARAAPAEYWESMCLRLVAYRGKHGDCDVPANHADRKLATWVGTQRTRRRRGNLLPEQEKRLLALGFRFEQQQETWEKRLDELAAYEKRQGHCRVPRFWEKNRALGLWVAAQRSRARQGTLLPERKARLDALGFVWDRQENAWAGHLSELKAFLAEHGHADVPHYYSQSDLGAWLGQQRLRARAGRLLPKRKAELLALGVTFDVRQAREEERYRQLVGFEKEHGHCDVPESWKAVPGLANWVARQRRLLRRGAKAPLFSRLQALGLGERASVNHFALVRWGERFASLAAFLRKQHRLPFGRRSKEEGALWAWMVAQRRARRQGRLSPAQVSRLDGMRFPWAGKWDSEHEFQREWEAGFARLLAFRKRHGHVLGPFRVHHPSLSQWVTKQRRHKRRGKLSQERVAKLEAVGFQWEGHKGRGLMDPYVDALTEYKRKHGHVWVTPGDDPVLGKWVQQQTALMQQGALEPRLERALVALGLPLTWDEQRWERLFASLCAFRHNHGHLRVPDGNELAKWLHAQKRLLRDGELEMDRELRLRELGLTPK